jgi:PAS domain S-box-containing protein
MEARRVPNSEWYIAAKMDVAEFNAPIDRFGREVGSVLLALSLAIAAAAGWIRKSRQLQLQHQVEERFRAIADDTPALLWMASPGEYGSFVNKTFAKFLGAEGQKLSDWTVHVHPDDLQSVQSGFLEAMSHARGFLAVLRMCRFDGEYRTCVSEALPRFSANGKFLGLCGSVADITDQAEAERKLISANTVLSQGLAEKTEREAEIRALSARLIKAQEEERSRLSRELHDDLSQQIAAVSIGMGNLKRNLPENQTESRKQSDSLQQKLVDLSEAVRRISHELHPAVLQHSGLAAALRAYCDEFEALMQIRVQLKTEGSFQDLPSTVALTIYRIVQEALRNVARHAQVDAAEIGLVDSGEELRLTVADRGVGIPADKLSRPGGLGLVSIRERTRLVNGTMQVQTSPNQGTTLTIMLPKR